jgi:hypothetical protein
MTTKTDPDMPAFPRTYSHDGHNGMTLRDYFAAAALPAIYSESVAIMEKEGFPDEAWRTGIAMDAYAMADAMLAERDKS